MAGGHGALPSDPVARALARAHGILPDQGPIGVFVHHNTLHAFQHQPFFDGIEAGAALLGARPYLPLAAFRAAWRTGRVADDDVRTEIARTLGDGARVAVAPGLSMAALWHTLMTADVHEDAEDAAGLTFAVDAGTAPESRDRGLWAACLARVVHHGPPPPAEPLPAPRRHRDVLLALGAGDTDVAVHAELVRLGAGFLDQGQAHTVLPARERGFLAAVAALYAAGAPAPRACRGVERDMARVAAGTLDARGAIDESLAALGVGGDDVEPWLLATTVALPGWTGMFARLERHPEDHADGPPARLIECLAVRLLLERHAVARSAAVAGRPHAWPALAALAPRSRPVPAPVAASRLWHLSLTAGWTPAQVTALSAAELSSVWTACASCGDTPRRKAFQAAYERTYRRTVLDAMAVRRSMPPSDPPGRARAQFVFCIDEREESIRRALEEQDPGFVTYGAAGFFGVAIDYQGLYDREPAAYCPVVVTPGHEVHEQPVYTALSWHALRKSVRDAWLGWIRRSAAASRTLTGGAGLSFLLGPIVGLKTLARVAAPRASLRLSDRAKQALAPRPSTRLSAVRLETSADGDHRRPLGFSLEDAVDRVTATLVNLGLTRGFAPVVVVLGHGSTSLNNPHESAHDCGACGGRRGGANARLFADMANRPDVRAGLRARGIEVPADTWFVGALHDTADDSVRFYDLDALPPALAPAFDVASAALERARQENARERCRRFDDAPLGLTPRAALVHVEARSAHLAQPRPEYGHCTNALCYVGRRSLTRGLHLDRRAFLVSYDPAADPEVKVLERILAAVGPVGAGISLEYYFSAVDNERFGCGTKLPHNVTGLIGVMNGHQGDLRTGLPWQMVELHEPMRLLLVVDASPEALLTVASRQAEVAELVGGGWVQLVSMHPESGALAVFEDGAFVPYEPAPTLLPVVEASPEWHGHTRAFVGPALVRRALPVAVVGPGHHGLGGAA